MPQVQHPMNKRALLIIPYTLFILAFLGFLLYYLTINPGGPGGDKTVVWVLTAFASGGMMLMAIYGLTLFLFRPGEKAALFFSLICVSASVRFFVLSGSETIKVFIPGFPLKVILFLEYITLALMIVFVHRFWYELFIKPKYKKRVFALETFTLTAFTIGGIINALSGYGIFILHFGLFLLSLIVMVHIAVQTSRSPEFKKNRFNRLYFISLIIYIIMPVVIAFLSDKLPNAAVFSNMMMVIVHVIILSQRYSRTIDDNELLDKLNRTKSELFANISHSMKTPLTIIATDIQLAQEFSKEKQIDKENELLQEAWQETMKLADQITGAITLSRSREISREMSLIDFDAVVESVLKMYDPLIKKQENTILRNIEKVPKIWSNTEMLASAVTNVLDNANRHTKNGIINVSLSTIDNEACLKISDNGEGIPHELLPRVFEHGVSGASSSGAGLAIVKSIMELHNGKVDIESVVGKGTTVKLLLPPPPPANFIQG